MLRNGPSSEADCIDETIELLRRVRAGDKDALERLLDIHIPPLRRWAKGRLPPWARDAADTSDLVQETVLATLKHLDRFEPRGVGALQAYLKQAVLNRVRNALRRRTNRPVADPLDSNVRDMGASPLETAIGLETFERYEAALDRLKLEEREAIVGRVELGMSYAELAAALDKRSANTARMTVVRALERLAAEMRRKS